MGHLIGSLLGIITFVLLLRWYERRKFKLFPFIVEVIATGILFAIGYAISNYLSKSVHISIPLYNRIPEDIKKWFWFTIFFIGCCTLSIKSWIHFNKIKRSKGSNSS
ncbi:hypothetical protein ACFO4N_17000 [Camelliibacillus cellulosilyticus]|uniref:Uncharacterized protein n=1 Tax=Camelliibacillus cellulosilyticus TaxID=2174486 RepID=A0ABV9GSZ9_9BACL